MSCYEWESGTITLPSKDYVAFRKTIIGAWNSRQLSLFDRAKAALPVVKAACSGKKSWQAADAAYKTAITFWHDPQELLDLIQVRKDDKVTFKSPKKKDLKTKPISKPCVLYFEDAHICFNEGNRSVTWSVEENNHAREHSRSHPIARLFFSSLNKINWVRGTGGVIVGNDEYNRDSDHLHGGGNYVTAKFGPLGIKA